MFLGQFQHTIDEKGRMTIPVRYRELLEGGAYITEGFESSLMVLRKENFETMSNSIAKESLTNPLAREFKRIIYGGARELEFDKAGRILIPAFLREMAQLTSDAVVVGMGESFEIWSPENWKLRQSSNVKAKADEQRFAALNIVIR